MNIQWYPGHMVKAKRLVKENLKLVDMVIELVDARIPASSRNPEIDEIIGEKPRLIVMNKGDLVDKKDIIPWQNYFKARAIPTVIVNSINGQGFRQLEQKAMEITAERRAHYASKGYKERAIRAMIVGIPNVGKSSFINQLAGKGSAKTGDKPGVTKGKQWVRISKAFELLDTPGILWPKFEDPEVGFRLAVTGAIKDEILDTEGLALWLVKWFADNAPGALKERYKLSDLVEEPLDNLRAIGKRRGFLIPGGEIDTLKAAVILLDEFRAAKIGKFVLENPPETQVD